ncbi:TPM domain-containing protein [Govanella unica]|uniref:TPM domain-containing protein n=1 Tax=Govanella unica TaxID=2975056 RepID=A0A9X3TXR6_9PROT|nr:TPM domain-containing protein [Govania unica]MDA5193297.1 TPM domain-containing protein [Govania unica]
MAILSGVRILSLRLFLCVLLLVLPGTFAVHAQSFPALTGRVVDDANLLTPADKATLTARLEQLEAQSQRQLVVVTLPSLQGYDIEDYGYQLGRKWGIGSKERNDGALLIVAPNERKVRVEVGYGLEPILTDALSSTIISRDILPHFRDGQYSAGIVAGADSIAKQLELPEDQARAVAAEAAKAAKKQETGGPSLFFWVIFFFIFVLPALRSMFGGGRTHRGARLWGAGLGAGLGGLGGWGRGGGGGGFGGGGGGFGGGGSSGSW